MGTYKVYLKAIKFYGYHGVLPEEQKKGQEFTIDVKYKFEKRETADDIDATVNYSKVFLVIKQTFEAKRYNLLENLAQDIANSIIASFSEIRKVKVSVWKINPPIEGKVEAIGVTYKSRGVARR